LNNSQGFNITNNNQTSNIEQFLVYLNYFLHLAQMTAESITNNQRKSAGEKTNFTQIAAEFLVKI